MEIASFSKILQASTASKTWYAAQVQPRREKLAAMHLERQNFETFLPKVKRHRVRRGRATCATEVLFPGYLFVAFDRDWDAWRSINSTIGVSRLVMFGAKPAALPEEFVHSLIDAANDDDVVSFGSELRKGDAVRILGGALDNVTGTLLNGDGQARVTILIELLSGPRRVSIERKHLIAG